MKLYTVTYLNESGLRVSACVRSCSAHTRKYIDFTPSKSITVYVIVLFSAQMDNSPSSRANELQTNEKQERKKKTNRSQTTIM